MDRASVTRTWWPVLAFVALASGAGCGNGTSEDGDADGDVDGDTDIDGDIDIDGDVDGDTDTDTDADGDTDGDADAESDGDADDDGDIDVEPDCSFCEGRPVPGCCPGRWSCPDGECRFRCDNGAEPPLIWDIDAIEDPSTLAVVFDEDEGYPQDHDGVVLHSVWFTSWQWGPGADGAWVRHDRRIHALVAVPDGLGEARVPGVLIGHGLHGQVEPGGSSTYDEIINKARSYQVVTIGISAPGNGLSEGDGTQASRGGSDCILFNSVPDPRGSWFYAYALAGMRALTYLGTLPEVDTDRLVVTGSSGGGVMSLIINGVDRRVRAAVPISACGALDVSAASESWVSTLITVCDPTEEQLDGVFRFIDPINYAPTACSPTFLMNGFQDEFFPVNATRATYEALLRSGQPVWWDIQPDWDHGYFALPLGRYCASYFNLLSAVARSLAGFSYWMHHYVFETPDFGFQPELPVLAATDLGDGTARFEIDVDHRLADHGWAVEYAYIFMSDDDACTVNRHHDRDPYVLPCEGDPALHCVDEIALPAGVALDDLAYWAEVRYLLPATMVSVSIPVFGDIDIDFVLHSTSPYLPEGFDPQVRPMAASGTDTDPCVPGTCVAREP